MKIIGLLIPAFVFAPIIRLFETYIFDDWQFAITMIILVGLDTFLGILYSWKSETISSKKFSNLFYKIIIYGVALVTVHSIANHTVNGKENNILASLIPWIDSVIYSLILLREVLSIDEKCGKLGYPFLPKFIRKKYMEFDKNGIYQNTNQNLNEKT